MAIASIVIGMTRGVVVKSPSSLRASWRASCRPSSFSPLLADERFESLEQGGRCRAKLGAVGNAQPAKNTRSFDREVERCFATVLSSDTALDESSLARALHELHGAVVLDLQTLRDGADRGSLG